MSTPPTISVVVTCYNLGRYLDEAVDSILTQTYQDFEIVIINDGSTDADTNALLASYDRPRTRVVEIENRGLPGARNEGIRQTTGRYVCIVDADDMLERTYFEKAVAVLDADPSIAFVSHWLRTFGDEEREWKPTSADFPALLDMNSINGAALVRREALLAVGGYDESMRHGCEDWDLWISMVERGLRGTILPEILFFYRRRTDSMSRVMMEGQTHVDLYRYLIEKHRPSFAAYAADLLIRRENDWAGLLRESHDLELDCTTGLEPERDRLRDTVRVLQRKVDRLRAQAAQETELARRQTIMTDMDTELAHRQETIVNQAAELERRANALSERSALLTSINEELRQDREGIAGLQREIQMLRGSLSWRLTRPLRSVYSRLFERK